MKKYLFILFISLGINSFAQVEKVSVQKVSSNSMSSDTISNKKDVEIIHADKLKFYTNKEGKAIRKMVGNVQLKQDRTLLYCDSAFLLKEENKVDMYGHVRITDGDSITATSRKLKYDGDEKKAELIGDAQLTDNKMVLNSEVLYYDKITAIGYYLTGGKLINGNTVLTSEKGYYHSRTSEAFFKENVQLRDPRYKLDSDTLVFNTKTEIAEFYGNTSIYNDESTITCNNGTYDTQEQIATFGYGTTIFNAPQVLQADSLYYDKGRAYGKAMKAFDWEDTEMKVSMSGTEAEYFEERKEIIAIERPLLILNIDEDTLFLKGDTIIAKNDVNKSFTSFDKIRIFKTDLQAVCDSLYYNQSDSALKFFKDPILWNEQSEMKADTIIVDIRNNQIDQMHFIDNSFIVTQSLGKLFDQVKGKWITAFFRDSSLKKMLVEKNAESLYFGKNDKDEYMGGNSSKSSKMWIYTKENKINKIVFIDKPEAIFTPQSQMTEDMLYLKDFKLNWDIKPKSKNDLNLAKE